MAYIHSNFMSTSRVGVVNADKFVILSGNRVRWCLGGLYCSGGAKPIKANLSWRLWSVRSDLLFCNSGKVGFQMTLSFASVKRARYILMSLADAVEMTTEKSNPTFQSSA